MHAAEPGVCGGDRFMYQCKRKVPYLGKLEFRSSPEASKTSEASALIFARSGLARSPNHQNLSTHKKLFGRGRFLDRWRFGDNHDGYVGAL